jgi:hypothetical protein
MDYAREKKVIWSKSRILIVLACVAVLLHSLRGLSVVYQVCITHIHTHTRAREQLKHIYIVENVLLV